MSLYYTINEFIEQIKSELTSLNTYTQLLDALITREALLFSIGGNLNGIQAELETDMEAADAVLEQVGTNLGNIDTTKFAFEVRVGAIVFGGGASVPGNYHHAKILVTAFDSWTIFSANAEDVSVSAFDALSPATGITGLFSIEDKVEISKIGNNFLEGVFTISAESTEFITLKETNNPGAVARADVPNVVIRLREIT